MTLTLQSEQDALVSSPILLTNVLVFSPNLSIKSMPMSLFTSWIALHPMHPSPARLAQSTASKHVLQGFRGLYQACQRKQYASANSTLTPKLDSSRIPNPAEDSQFHF
jgi:hypothetical protein